MAEVKAAEHEGKNDTENYVDNTGDYIRGSCIFTLIFLYRDLYLKNRGYHNIKPIYKSGKYEMEKDLIVPFTYARPQPCAMVVESEDAVVAVVAM